MSKDKKKAVIYARVSSITDRQNTDRQVEDLSRYAEENNLEIVGIYNERASGRLKINEREVLSQCLDFCFHEQVDILLISELSRLGRNVEDILHNIKICQERKLNIFFQKENLSIFNQDGSENSMLTVYVSVLGTFAQIEWETIKFRLNSGRRRYIENGGILGRKKGSVKTKETKAIEYKNVIRELKHGTSIRRTAKLCDVSVSTVQRLKKEFNL